MHRSSVWDLGAAPPGVDAELLRRFRQWVIEVYSPMLLKISAVTGVDNYQIVRESPQYPSYGSIVHHQNLKMLEDSLNAPERNAVFEEFSNWAKRGVQEGIWARAYELTRSFRSEPRLLGSRADSRIDNAPIMHLEGHHLSPEEQEKYSKWLSDYGYNVFIPLFVKFPGLKGYDCYQDTGLKSGLPARESEYPPCLSIVYFENLKAFEDYTKSPELVTFQKAIRAVFPLGLELKWYVQYQLVKSWRK